MPLISERIKALRKAFDISQDDFSKKMGISRSTLTLLEADKSQPSYDLVKKMSNEYNISPVYFFDDKATDINNYFIKPQLSLKEMAPEQLEEKQRNYFRQANKLKKQLLADKSLSAKHRNILDLLWELQHDIDELKVFADKYIDLYDPELPTSFIAYLQDENTLLPFEVYKQKIANLIERFTPYEFEIDVTQGHIEDFLKAVAPIRKSQ